MQWRYMVCKNALSRCTMELRVSLKPSFHMPKPDLANALSLYSLVSLWNFEGCMRYNYTVIVIHL